MNGWVSVHTDFFFFVAFIISASNLFPRCLAQRGQCPSSFHLRFTDQFWNQTLPRGEDPSLLASLLHLADRVVVTAKGSLPVTWHFSLPLVWEEIAGGEGACMSVMYSMTQATADCISHHPAHMLSKTIQKKDVTNLFHVKMFPFPWDLA